ncbi:MAG TPA: cobalt-factor II C(20)-methyltransferase [Epulopiscium sp.]|nr:cobalt-factor II C(20)-methyltransferase [Candidatus Epulonipiscium sp.]
MKGKLYGIGVGPGDPELLTMKAVRIIQSCDVVIAPSAMAGGESIALDITKGYILESTETQILHFPMGTADREDKIYAAYQIVESYLLEGKTVAFLTIGDPFVYSTYIYLLEHFRGEGYDIETVPGITSFCASASIAGVPLVIGDENLLILPGNKIEEVEEQPYIVIMKVYKQEEKIIDHLESKGYTYTYIKRAGREGQEVLTDKEAIKNNREYMALIIASKIMGTVPN